ncbi:murein L,D-transpeptidase YafK [Rhodopseudomonas rhenobacensis]|uniref:Murein L,D-transpeptidase YafK n=1 Tax=Rhodopseudomonas rhenobacensis TaxID=87461 RepID=A0A7W7Z429_9BRAD|nr:murein L,D-transpeptidase family protein [Rhodopseudomonas rhenobacensis]MBB5047626.1 murein L,D-transpeptidase YafK [Rhodopseudomonas rhenobacensis]
MIDRTLVRALVTSVALATGVMLAGCNSDEISLANNAKANQPVSPKLIAEMQAKDMDLQAPMLVRLFKQEAELEVWKQTRSGQFALLKTYPICRWSGDLGPKVREGDRQAPEGFYNITPAQMNPQSAYYLSFNTGYPNAFDKALGRTGSQLMVHGDCSSRGCYAMTDEQIAEIYSLGRESFFGGQRAFQLQAYPFKMTPVNMAKHRDNPNMPFWKMIKEGYDHFEVTRQEPKVEFCEAKYVFDPAAPPNASRPLAFNAAAKCPAYVIPSEIADAVRQKQRQDDVKTAELVAKGIPVAQRRPDIDGGMNRIFASKIPDGATGLSEPDAPGLQTAFARAPGTIPAHVNPPKATVATASEEAEQLANSRAASPSQGLLNNLAQKSSSETTATTAPAKPKLVVAPKPASEPARPASVVAVKPPAAKPGSAPHQVAAARPPLKPSVSSADAAAPSAPARGGTLSGAQPVVSANSFENRFSAMR